MSLVVHTPTHSADVRAARLFTVLLLLAALLIVPFTVHAQQPGTYAERFLFDAANRERAAQGLPALHWDDSLAAAAREHAIRMAQRNTLSHQLPGELPLQDRTRMAGARYTTIAENVAQGPTPEGIHSGWMHSSPHRANLLDPGLNAIGIAVAGVSGGSLFAVEDFSQSVASLNYQQQEKQVSSQLAARGLAVNSSDAARKTCEMDRGWAGDRPSLVVRYESGDLNRLPQDLETKLQTGKYHSAVVGACEPAGSNRGFTHFRVAVLLY